MAYYRNNVTGKVQEHPVAGIGRDLNSTEVDESGKPLAPATVTPPTERPDTPLDAKLKKEGK